MFRHKITQNKKKSKFSCGAQSGLAFMEIVIALLILSVAALSMLQTVNVAMDANYRATQEIIADNLVSALLSEIMTKNFEDSDGDATLGDEGENRYSAVIPYDDVDDYENFQDSPPITINNTAMDGTGSLPDYRGWTRKVKVHFVRLVPDSDPEIRADYQTNKTITVMVSGPGVGNFSVSGIRTKY